MRCVCEGQPRLRRCDLRSGRLAGAGWAIEEQRCGAVLCHGTWHVAPRARQHGGVGGGVCERQQQRLLHLLLHLRRTCQRVPRPPPAAATDATATAAVAAVLVGAPLGRERHQRAHSLQEVCSLCRAARQRW